MVVTGRDGPAPAVHIAIEGRGQAARPAVRIADKRAANRRIADEARIRREGRVGIAGGKRDIGDGEPEAAFRACGCDAGRQRHLRLSAERTGDAGAAADVGDFGKQGAIAADIRAVGAVRARRELGKRWSAGRGGGGNGRDRDRLPGESGQGGIDFPAFDRGDDVAAKRVGKRGRRLLDVPVAFQQRGRAIQREVDEDAIIIVDAQDGGFDFLFVAAASRGRADLELCGGGAETGAKHEVHNPLIRAIAIGERGFLWQHLHPDDGFGRDRADFLKAGNAAAVQQHHGHFPAPAPAAAGLRRELGEQVCHAAGAIGTDVGRVQHQFGLHIGNDRAARPAGDDDDILPHVGIGRRCGGNRLRFGNGRRRRILGGGGDGEADEGEGGARGRGLEHGHTVVTREEPPIPRPLPEENERRM